MEIEGEDIDHLAPFERVDPYTLRTRWVHTKPLQMRLRLVSVEASLQSRPTPLAVGLRTDRVPRLTLRHRGVRSRISPTAMIPLQLTAQDDFSLSTMAVYLTTRRPLVESETRGEPGGEPETPLPQRVQQWETSDAPAHLDQEYQLELLTRNLQPGDVVALYSEATDQCHLGSQTGQSRTLMFRVVAPEQLFSEILLRHQGLRAWFRLATDATETIEHDMKIEPRLEPKAAAMLRRVRVNQRQVRQVLEGVVGSAEEMKLNRLGGDEAYSLIQRQIIKPMRRLYEQTLTGQRRALESLSREENESSQQIVDRQHTIVEQMKNILARMDQWDSFIDVVNQLNSIIDLEQRVEKSAEQLQESQTESLFDD